MASNMHMKITGPDIPGEGSDANHLGEIVLLSFSHSAQRGIVQSGPAGTREPGNATLTDFVITKLVDKATPLITKSVLSGGPHAQVKVTLDKKSPNGETVEFFVYTLSSVLVTSQSIGGSEGSGVPMESVSLNALKVEWAYTPTDPQTGDAQGVVPFGFDLEKNAEV